MSRSTDEKVGFVSSRDDGEGGDGSLSEDGSSSEGLLGNDTIGGGIGSKVKSIIKYKSTLNSLASSQDHDF